MGRPRECAFCLEPVSECICDDEQSERLIGQDELVDLLMGKPTLTSTRSGACLAFPR